jgi:hypothetical protein
MATTLDQIMSELDPYYSSSKGLYNQQLAALPKQGEAEIKGLDAKLAKANSNILDGARGRGLGFSGIPLAEQAEYAATDYAPAVARVKQGQETSRMSILEALNGLDREKRTTAQSIFESSEARRLQQEQLAEQRRQFDESQRAAARAASGGGSAGIGAYLGGGGGAAQQAPSIQDQAYVSVQRFLQGNDNQIRSDYQATLKSANNGNALDKLKVQLYQQSRPDLFKGQQVTVGKANSGGNITVSKAKSGSVTVR